MVTLLLPKIHSNAALMSQGLLDPQGTFSEQRVKDVRKLGGGNGKKVITDPVHTASTSAFGAGKQAAEGDEVTNIVDIPLPARDETRG